MEKNIMSYFYRISILLALLTVVLGACAAPVAVTAPQAGVGGRLVIYSGRSEPLLKPALDAFKTAHPEVEMLLKAGSNSEDGFLHGRLPRMDSAGLMR